jgi:hypothetical protein
MRGGGALMRRVRWRRQAAVRTPSAPRRGTPSHRTAGTLVGARRPQEVLRCPRRRSTVAATGTGPPRRTVRQPDVMTRALLADCGIVNRDLTVPSPPRPTVLPTRRLRGQCKGNRRRATGATFGGRRLRSGLCSAGRPSRRRSRPGDCQHRPNLRPQRGHHGGSSYALRHSHGHSAPPSGEGRALSPAFALPTKSRQTTCASPSTPRDAPDPRHSPPVLSRRSSFATSTS